MRSYIIKIIHFVTKKFRSFPIFNLLVDYELDNGTMKSLRHIITVFYEIFQKEEIEVNSFSRS
jgi:succinyl-CoA synthetase beta subunit